jgi:hypothetical protein
MHPPGGEVRSRVYIIAPIPPLTYAIAAASIYVLVVYALRHLISRIAEDEPIFDGREERL